MNEGVLFKGTTSRRGAAQVCAAPRKSSEHTRSAFCKNVHLQMRAWSAEERLPLVLVPMEHMVVVYGNFCGHGKAAGHANQHILADLPMCAVLAFTYQNFNFLFSAHL
jgi:hypothetical protein